MVGTRDEAHLAQARIRIVDRHPGRPVSLARIALPTAVHEEELRLLKREQGVGHLARRQRRIVGELRERPVDEIIAAPPYPKLKFISNLIDLMIHYFERFVVK